MQVCLESRLLFCFPSKEDVFWSLLVKWLRNESTLKSDYSFWYTLYISSTLGMPQVPPGNTGKCCWRKGCLEYWLSGSRLILFFFDCIIYNYNLLLIFIVSSFRAQIQQNMEGCWILACLDSVFSFHQTQCFLFIPLNFILGSSGQEQMDSSSVLL